MGDLFNNLGIFEMVLFVIAASSTLILIIQTIFSFSGMGGDGDFDMDSGVDFDADLDVDADFAESASGGSSSGKGTFDADGMRLITVRGILAFLMMGGWVGFIAIMADIPPLVALLFAVAAGAASMYGIARLLQAMMRLHNDGTLRVSNAIGQTGTVYIKIPGEEKGMGKVSVTVQERLCEFDAVTEDTEGLKTGDAVYVTDVRTGNVLVVEKVVK